MIKSVSYSQEETLQNIIDLHLEGKDIECDPTYSKGVFYRGNINKPKYTFDLEPQDSMTEQADCRKLPLPTSAVTSLVFDPPFVIGSGPSLLAKVDGQSVIQKRFSGFRNKTDLLSMYSDSLREFYRVLAPGGTLIFKCQDVVASSEQILSHVEIINYARELGFYCKDLFVLVAKNRLLSGKIKKQQHARKYHCYFLVFKKSKT